MSNHLDLANLQTEITELRHHIASIEAARPNDAAADTIEQFCSRWGTNNPPAEPGALSRLAARSGCVDRYRGGRSGTNFNVVSSPCRSPEVYSAVLMIKTNSCHVADHHTPGRCFAAWLPHELPFWALEGPRIASCIDGLPP